ncbi:helix-turn-helix domain-containing protein [Knoellia locipacati]|uniref:helix-turn-helix domain-containing protein n=1 Tax=Knoellia locipacati TaxID=882824 RepID=UPI00384E2DF7
MNQRGLAHALGWDRAKVGRWEAGAVPAGFDEVLALLRILGFGVHLTDPHAGSWSAWDGPAEHVVDRAGRRFPAHLELCEEHELSPWNWTRHRGEPSPLASGTSFRRRTQATVVAEEARRGSALDAPCAPDPPGPTASTVPTAPTTSGARSTPTLDESSSPTRTS